MSPQNARYNCSIDAAMAVIEGRWKGTIICMLAMDGTLRFSELQRKIGEITSRILSKQLKELESDGMVTRTVVPEGKVKVEYSLTEKGRSIIPVLRSLAEWGAQKPRIGYVPQTITLAECSIAENVALGVPPEKIDREKVLQCLRIAQAEKFISKGEAFLL